MLDGKSLLILLDDGNDVESIGPVVVVLPHISSCCIDEKVLLAVVDGFLGLT